MKAIYQFSLQNYDAASKCNVGATAESTAAAAAAAAVATRSCYICRWLEWQQLSKRV